MTHAQRQLVRQTLDQIRQEAEPVTLLLYGKLFEIDPSLKHLFHNDLMAQGRKLIATLETVAASLDRWEALRPRLLQLGRLHADYGVRPDHYDMVVTAALWAFGQAMGPDFDARAREAWRIALTEVAAVMQEGAAVHRLGAGGI